MRLPLPVADEIDLGVEPLCALNTVVLPQTRQVLGRVAVLVLGEVLWREEVGLDLVDVSIGGCVSSLQLFLGLNTEVERGLPRMPPGFGQRLLVSDTHLDDNVMSGD